MTTVLRMPFGGAVSALERAAGVSTVPALRPGDVLLYSGTGLFSALIRIKTWSRFSHVEVYDCVGHAVASRDGIGVGLYPFRHRDLAMVLRPREPFALEGARAWFRSVNGQGYDWLGLTCFFIARWQGRDNCRMFCSEFACRYLRAGGLEPFHQDYDADAVSPGMFAASPAFDRIWPRERTAA